VSRSILFFPPVSSLNHSRGELCLVSTSAHGTPWPDKGELNEAHIPERKHVRSPNLKILKAPAWPNRVGVSFCVTNLKPLKITNKET